MRSTRLTVAVSAFVVALLGGPVQANAADTILSGSIKSSAGEAMGGVMVSAKPEGGTITTTVLTDEAGRYYFPPLAAGKYRVWAQALSFAAAKGEIDLGSVKTHDFTLRPMDDFFRQLPGNCRKKSSIGRSVKSCFFTAPRSISPFAVANDSACAQTRYFPVASGGK